MVRVAELKSPTGDPFRRLLLLNPCGLAESNLYLLELAAESESAQPARDESYRLKLKVALDSMNDAVFISDLDGNFIDFNEAFATFHKFTDKTECAKTLAEYPGFLEVFWPDGTLADLKDWAVPRALRGESAMNAEYHLRRKDTGETWVGSYSFAPIRAADGRITGSVVVGRDITEQKKVQAEFLETRERFEIGFERSAIGMALNDLQGRFIKVNETMSKMFGKTREELIGVHFDDLTYYEDLELGHFAFPKLMSGEIPAILMEKRYLRADGQPFWASLTSTLMRDSENKPTFIMTQIMDINERRVAEEKSKKDQKTLQLFIQYAPAAIAMFDKEMRYMAVSSRFLEDYRISDPNIIGKTHYEVFPEIGDAWKQIHQRCLKGAVERCSADPFPRADGRVDWVRWEIHPWYEQNGEVSGIFLFSEVISDLVTAREKIETQLNRLSSLHSIDVAIASTFDMRLMLDVVLQQVMANLKVDAADILLYDQGINALVFSAEKGFHVHHPRDFTVPLGQGLAGKTALDRKPLFVPDLLKTSIKLIRSWLVRDEEFKTYYGIPLIVKGQLKGVVEVFYRTERIPDAEWEDYFVTLAGQAAIAVDNAEIYEGLRSANFNLTMAYDATIEGWSRAMDLRDRETEDHTIRVTDLTLRLMNEFGVSASELNHIRRGCLLHDIGKLGVPDVILHKPGPLDEDEWVIMRQHPKLAYELLFPIDYLRPALDIPYGHHEKWDGSGYPRGIKGNQIPLSARIFAVVDVWDALTSDRPYRKAWPIDKTIEYIQSQSGSHFDPEVVQVFMRLMNG